MCARRARILVVTIFSLCLLSPLLVTSTAAATCTLTAPATVAVGTPVAIIGSGFPASSSVDISLTLEGGSPDEFAVQSDANGAFQISLTPEAADAGKTTVVASAGAACTAEVVFTVGASASTPAPEPTAAGGGTGPTAPPPRTDAEGTVQGRTSEPMPAAWPIAMLLFLLGLGGLLATRSAKGR